MEDKVYSIETKKGQIIEVSVKRDKRLKKSSRWQWQSKNVIQLRVPYFLRTRVIKKQLEEISSQLNKQEKVAKRRTDADLQARADYLNKKYFHGSLSWKAIRWVNNMEFRLGSCSTGGTTDGHIRISNKIKDWPQWVVDYVILHELVHRIHTNHSSEFWNTLQGGYPLTERARGFIRGVSYAQGTRFEEAE
jgi:predicted metal-dependent hydrolase